MIRSTKAPLAFVFIALNACAPAYAGDAKAEAARCSRWMDAMLLGDMEQAALISAEQLNAQDVPDVYVTAQRENLTRLFNRLNEVGSPAFERMLDDKVVDGTGDIIKLEAWKLGASKAYVGCVSYPGIDTPWHLEVRFGDKLDALTTVLESAAKSRLAAPRERQ